MVNVGPVPKTKIRDKTPPMGTGADEKGGNVPVQSPTDTEKEEVRE